MSENKVVQRIMLAKMLATALKASVRSSLKVTNVLGLTIVLNVEILQSMMELFNQPKNAVQKAVMSLILRVILKLPNHHPYHLVHQYHLSHHIPIIHRRSQVFFHPQILQNHHFHPCNPVLCPLQSLHPILQAFRALCQATCRRIHQALRQFHHLNQVRFHPWSRLCQ